MWRRELPLDRGEEVREIGKLALLRFFLNLI